MENDQPGHNEELVPKRGTTSVAWSRVFKHCSLIQTDFKPLKHKQQSYMRAPSLCLCERSTFFRFIGFERLHEHTYMRQNPRLCKYPHKHSDLGLKREKTAERENAYVTVDILDPVFCRLGLPCQILPPPIKTVGKLVQIRQRKMLPVKLCFINVYTNPKPTLTVMQIH